MLTRLFILLRDVAMILKYLSTSVFCDGGITQSVNQKEPERFVAQRLFCTRELRAQLWKYILKRMKNEIWPPNRLLIMDFESAGPHVIDNNVYSHRTDLEHNLGEADLSWPFYFWLFHEQTIVVETIDTDIIPISICYMQQADPSLHPVQLYWRCMSRGSFTISEEPSPDDPTKMIKKRKYNGSNKDAEYCDLTKMAIDLPRAIGLTQLQTVLFCILSGSDFVQKKWLSFFANLSNIQDGVRALKNLELISQEDHNSENTGFCEQYNYAMLASRIRYSSKYLKQIHQEGRIETTQFCTRRWLEPRLHFARQAQFPSPETLKLANRLIRFNLCYWCTSWHGHTLLRKWTNIHCVPAK